MVSEQRQVNSAARKISVIIVNYNTAELALAAIESVLSRSHGGRTVDVHLVDNASPRGDRVQLAKAVVARGWTNVVTLYQETQNIGFGRGNNVVLAELTALQEPPEYVFLLNPDAALKNEAIAVLADFLDDHSQVAVAGCRIETVTGLPAAAAFRFPTMIGTFVGALAFSPVSHLLKSWLVPLPPVMPTQAVDWVSGAAVMFRLASVRRAGLFDPAYFLYFEEVDLMLRISRRGEQVWHVAEALVTHVEGAATHDGQPARERKRLPSFWYDSWRHYFVSNHGRIYALAAAVAWYLGASGNWLLTLFLRRPPATPKRFYVDFWAVAARPILGFKARRHD